MLVSPWFVRYSKTSGCLFEMVNFCYFSELRRLDNNTLFIYQMTGFQFFQYKLHYFMFSSIMGSFYFFSMLKTLERYQKCSYGAVEVSRPCKELEVV